MAHYIDGFILPIRQDRLAEYRAVANAVAEIYVEHGAIEYREFVGDDMVREGTCHFPDLLTASDDECVVFGWIIYESRESRDSVNQLVEADPRMVELVAPLLDPENPVFMPTRMAYGGFQPFVSTVTAAAD